MFSSELSTMDVRDYGISIRSRAIGQLESGITQKVVSQSLSISQRSVRRWWHAYKFGKSLETIRKSGRQIQSRVAKIVISKSLGKRKQSRKIDSELANKGISMSKSTVHRHLKTDLKVKSYKRPKIPRLSQKMKENRVKIRSENY